MIAMLADAHPPLQTNHKTLACNCVPAPPSASLRDARVLVAAPGGPHLGEAPLRQGCMYERSTQTPPAHEPADHLSPGLRQPLSSVFKPQKSNNGKAAEARLPWSIGGGVQCEGGRRPSRHPSVSCCACRALRRSLLCCCSRQHGLWSLAHYMQRGGHSRLAGLAGEIKHGVAGPGAEVVQIMGEGWRTWLARWREGGALREAAACGERSGGSGQIGGGCSLTRISPPSGSDIQNHLNRFSSPREVRGGAGHAEKRSPGHSAAAQPKLLHPGARAQK
jgi:hypothetical protein